jgi:hypothetical protein
LKKNTNIFDRIVQLSDIKGFRSIPDLAAYMGYDSPEKLYRLKRKLDAMPSADMVTDFSNKFEDLNLRWLLTGEEPMLIDTKNYTNIQAVANHFNEPDEPYGRPMHIAKEAQKAAITAYPQFITVDSKGKENILFISTIAATDYLSGRSDPEYLKKQPSFCLPWLPPATYRLFEVNGNSMAPTLEDKWHVLGQWLDKPEDIRDDDVHVVIMGDGNILIKRLSNCIQTYGYIIAKSDAVDDGQQYPDIKIYPHEIEEIWLVTLFFGNTLRYPKDIYKRLNDMEASMTEVLKLLKNNDLLPSSKKEG